MRSLVTYTVEWRVLKSSSRVARRRRRRRRLDNASSWFAGGVTGRRGCCNARRLLITQSIHARLLLLLHDNHKLTLYSPHCCRHLANNIDYMEDLGGDVWTCHVLPLEIKPIPVREFGTWFPPEFTSQAAAPSVVQPFSQQRSAAAVQNAQLHFSSAAALAAHSGFQMIILQCN